MASKSPDLDDDTVVVILLGVVVAMAVGPTAVSALGVDAGSWLIAHQVLVAPAKSAITIPLTGGGLDWRRMVVACFVAGSVLIGGWARIRMARR